MYIYIYIFPFAQACSAVVGSPPTPIMVARLSWRRRARKPPTMAVSIADAGDANGRVVGCCWVATVAVVAVDVLFEEIDKAPLHCAAAQAVATLDGLLGWSLSAVLCVMLAVANAEECIAVEGLLLSCAFMARSCLTSSPMWGSLCSS